MAALVGTNGDNIIWATNRDDVVLALSGNDVVFGDTGNDFIQGDGGQDRIFGGDGDDILIGGADNDVIYGDLGNDHLYSNSGNGIGTDKIGGSNTLYGADGTDYLIDGAGDDILDGGVGNDILYSSGGNDTLTGGEGNDIFVVVQGDTDISMIITDFNPNDDRIAFYFTDSALNAKWAAGFMENKDKFLGGSDPHFEQTYGETHPNPDPKQLFSQIPGKISLNWEANNPGGFIDLNYDPEYLIEFYGIDKLQNEDIGIINFQDPLTDDEHLKLAKYNFFVNKHNSEVASNIQQHPEWADQHPDWPEVTKLDELTLTPDSMQNIWIVPIDRVMIFDHN
jgi:hypothetical protein